MNILVVFGTRPEAIKLAPLIVQLRQFFSVRVCITAQHRQMLDQSLRLFSIVPDYDLNLMRPNQSLSSLTASVLERMQDVLQSCRSDIVVVQGDTTTAMAAAMAAFYNRIPIAHVEAGLRSYNINSPYPEEFNRQVISKISKWHFCPTNRNSEALISEGVDAKNVFVTGNTVIDALFWTLKNSTKDIRRELGIEADKKILLVTGHRRESFGSGFDKICEALLAISKKYDDLDIVYPVHLNPNVKDVVHQKLSGVRNIHLIEPLSYESFAHLMRESYFILTDSGGVQEEAPSLAKPVLVMRDLTERHEAVESGVAKLIGTETQRIVDEVSRLVDHKAAYQEMANAANPYGDGRACERICRILKEVHA